MPTYPGVTQNRHLQHFPPWENKTQPSVKNGNVLPFNEWLNDNCDNVDEEGYTQEESTRTSEDNGRRLG